MRLCSVYCHISPSGKKYVGISFDPEKRWRHGRGYEKNYRFSRAINKYGWDSFDHVILAVLPVEDAKNMEKELIDKWDLTNYDCGYNLRVGGDGPFSEEAIAKMSASRKGKNTYHGYVAPAETRRQISESLKKYYSSHPGTMTGRHHSAETIAKLKARVVSEESIRKYKANRPDTHGSKNPSAKAVRQYTKSGEMVCEYPYAKLAAEKYGIDLSSIIKCCRGRAKTCGGYRWEYILSEDKPKEKNNSGG